MRDADAAGDADEDLVQLSVEDADQLTQMQMDKCALERALKEFQETGHLQAVRGVEAEPKIIERKERSFCVQNRDVAHAFAQLRDREAREYQRKRAIALEINDTRQAAKKIRAAEQTAVAELNKRRKALMDLEALREVNHAMKTFTAESLGHGHAKAGGAAAKQLRFEVLDPSARRGAALSPGQRTDFTWFKNAWDARMVEEYKEKWGQTFMEWVQEVINDPSTNAFSKFVYNESKRNFNELVALHVPGGRA